MTEMNQPLLIDIICCLDSTRSMAKPGILMMVKGILGCLPPEEYSYAWLRDLPLRSEVRYKLLTFRDFRQRIQKDVIDVNQFVDSAERFASQVDMTEFERGGDKPENALEALFMAMRSMSLVKEGSESVEIRRSPSQLRQVIVLFSDSVPFRPEGRKNRSRKRAEGYPKNMPDTLEKLKKLWNEGDAELLPGYQPGCGRLVICAPFTDNPRTEDELNWYQVTEGMDRTWYVPMDYFPEAPVFSYDDMNEAREMIYAPHPDQTVYREGRE